MTEEQGGPPESAPAGRPSGEEWLRRVRFVGVALPVLFLLSLQTLRATVLDRHWPEHSFLVAGTIGVIAAAAFGVWMFVLIDRGYRMVLAAQREAEDHRATLAERERLARELHDSLAQVLGVARLRLATLAIHPDVDPDGPVRRELDEVADLCHEAYADVRETILGLREAGQSDRSLLETLESYVHKYTRTSGVPTTLSVGVEGELRLPPGAEVQIIRVIQEALTNVRKHAGARTASVGVHAAADGVRFTVADDGRGFHLPHPADEREGYGLYAMRERAEQVGGTLVVDSRPGAGTRVTVTVPEAVSP